MWKLYDELMTYDKVKNSEVDVQKLTYEKLMILCKLGRWSKI